MNVITDEIDFSAYLRETEPKQRVKPASVYVAELIARLGKARVTVGQCLPWAKTRGVFRFRPGEVSLWAGVNGHGKSLMTGMIALNLIAQGHKVCVASFEMKPHRSVERLLRQWVGFDAEGEFGPADHGIEDVKELYEQFNILSDKRLWFYDQQGTVTVDQMCSVARYCAKELGIKHLFIDSLMKCVRGEDDYNGQKAFVDELTAIARDYGMHVHLVHHIKKLENELKRPDKFDVKGTGAITDQVDNVLLVWRNKSDKRTPQDDEDANLIVCKQRNGEWEGRIKLWFDRGSQQFVESAGLNPINFAQVTE